MRMNEHNLYVYTLRQILGDFDPNTKEFYLEVPYEDEILKIPNYTPTKQKDVDHKIVLNAFIDDFIFKEGIDENGDRYKSHQGQCQINIFSKNEDLPLKINDALLDRIDEFFEVEAHDFIQNSQWDNIENNVYFIDNPNNQSQIVSYSEYKTLKSETPFAPDKIILTNKYTRVKSIEEVKNTDKSFFIDENGTYVNGMTNLIFTQMLRGRIFEDFSSVYDRGFRKYISEPVMRSIQSDDPDTYFVPLEIRTEYDIYREGKKYNFIEECGIDVNVI